MRNSSSSSRHPVRCGWCCGHHPELPSFQPHRSASHPPLDATAVSKICTSTTVKPARGSIKPIKTEARVPAALIIVCSYACSHPVAVNARVGRAHVLTCACSDPRPTPRKTVLLTLKNMSLETLYLGGYVISRPKVLVEQVITRFISTFCSTGRTCPSLRHCQILGTNVEWAHY